MRSLRLLHRETVYGPKGEVTVYKDTRHNEYRAVHENGTTMIDNYLDTIRNHANRMAGLPTVLDSVLERIEFNVIDNRI
jgi:hypothetical protein